MEKRSVIVASLAISALLLGLTYLLFGIPQTTTFMTTQLKAINETEQNAEAVIAAWYAPLSPLSFGSQVLGASIADTDSKRQRGLSGTPYLPPGVVKLFIFDESQPWGFWMKDMNYPIDIFWLDESAQVVHIAANVSPDTYPTSFTPPVPARYVIETSAGFAAETKIKVGDIADLTSLLK